MIGISLALLLYDYLRYRLFLYLKRWSPLAQLRKPVFFARQPAYSYQTIRSARRPPKPAWVRREVIRLKALMPNDGCRKIATTFNRLHAQKPMNVRKTYVSQTIQRHQYDIQVLRREIKNRRPRFLPKNRVWSLDLTQVRDRDNQSHTLLGIVDAGTRANLCLQPLAPKASITLLRQILNVIERFGQPHSLRTDNEPVFTSRLFRFGLWLLNIKHQQSEKCCPWQNGKVERFFGILKERLKHHVIESQETLVRDLQHFRFWFNHVRVHQYLNGHTPAEAWNGQRPNASGQAVYYQGWNGALSGFYLLQG